ncbi:MAG: hypothetical protein IJI85_03205 [Clostridia bacterium]|nr:hypothetical protein [Clostridia bacterium]MBR0421567.1 hypothetical protein [Clostridia bacterium]
MGILSSLFGKKSSKDNPKANVKNPVNAVQKKETTPTSISYHLRGKPDANGLYPSELVMLSVAEKYKTTETNYPKYLTNNYEIPNPLKMLKDLKARGFVREGSPIETLSMLKLQELKTIASQLNIKGKAKREDIIAQLAKEDEKAVSEIVSERAWKLTNAGEAAIKANPYIQYFLEGHNYNVSEVGVTIWTVNEDYVENPNRLYRDIIFRQLNEQMNNAHLEFMAKKPLDSISTYKYCQCYRMMGLFIEEEGKSYINAADCYFQYIYKNINIHAGLQLINAYKLKMTIKDTKSIGELYNRFYDDIKLYPAQRVELQRLIDELGISGEEVRESLITSFKRADDTGIMTVNEAADFVLLELTGDTDKSKDLATKIAKNVLKTVR